MGHACHEVFHSFPSAGQGSLAEAGFRLRGSDFAVTTQFSVFYSYHFLPLETRKPPVYRRSPMDTAACPHHKFRVIQKGICQKQDGIQVSRGSTG